MKTLMTSLIVFIAILNFSCAEKTSPELVDDSPTEIKAENKIEKAEEVDIISSASEPWDEGGNSKTEYSRDEQNSMKVAVDAEEEVSADAKNEVETKEEELPRSKDEAEAKADHTAFNTLLKKHVSSSGIVNYQGFKNDISKLDAYLKDLSDNPVATTWSKNEKLSYWINAYNAFTIKLILDNYPVNSIQDISGGKPWDMKWIVLGGDTYSLNQIENEIIRPQFNEPRIHFAVNCAAQSCPPLANQAFTEDNLNALLDKQTRAFINNDRFNKIGANSAQVSKIFEWYGQDFGDLTNFLNKYSNTKLKSGGKITYSDYDWGLNNK